MIITYNYRLSTYHDVLLTYNLLTMNYELCIYLTLTTIYSSHGITKFNLQYILLLIIYTILDINYDHNYN